VPGVPTCEGARCVRVLKGQRAKVSLLPGVANFERKPIGR
jgi:hypothetical protein